MLSESEYPPSILNAPRAGLAGPLDELLGCDDELLLEAFNAVLDVVVDVVLELEDPCCW